MVINDSQVYSGRHVDGNAWLRRQQLHGSLGTDHRRKASAEDLSQGIASHGESFGTTQHILRFPKLRLISGVGEFDWRILSSHANPSINALHELLDDGSCIRGVACPFSFHVAPVVHQACQAITFHEIWSKNLGQPPLHRTSPQIHLE